MSGSIDRSKVVWQRCFKIPKVKLDLFLVHLLMKQSELSHFDAKWIFDADSVYYDVVVQEYGHPYPFQETEIEKFVGQL